jgi:hypothetical protein
MTNKIDRLAQWGLIHENNIKSMHIINTRQNISNI